MVSVCFIVEYACCGQTAAEGPKKSYARPQAELPRSPRQLRRIGLCRFQLILIKIHQRWRHYYVCFTCLNACTHKYYYTLSQKQVDNFAKY